MKTALLLTFVTLATTCFGQVDTTSIYSIALKYYNAHLDNVKSGTNEIFIESNNGITEKLPLQIGDRQVTILTWENQKDVYAKHGNKIRHVKIFPARTKDDLIEINFTPYFGEYKGKKKGYFLEVSDWVTIQFKFDCSDSRFKYWNTKTGGI
ncbi:MAG: hypothetical protein KF763_21290 [Cyclobacteriaceae bacterium]|nr:hypothetical protein [Cyclobacteriaceae bacterium]